MNAIRRVTAAAGIAAGILGLADVGLYFVYSGPPPEWNVLTRSLIGIVLALAFVVFLAGSNRIVRRTDEFGRWLADLGFVAGATYLATVLVAISLEAGAVYGANGRAVDPTIDGPLAMANVLLHGSIARVLVALFLVAVGTAILRGRTLPAWAGWSAVVVGALNAAYVPALYFGTDPASFYGALGWGNTALVGSLVTYWAFATGVALTRRR